MENIYVPTSAPALPPTTTLVNFPVLQMAQVAPAAEVALMERRRRRRRWMF